MVGTKSVVRASLCVGLAASLGLGWFGCSGGGGGGGGRNQGPAQGFRLSGPSRSTSIALTSDDRRLVVVNRETDSLAILEVRKENGEDSGAKIAEISVGQEPRYLALSPDDSTAYVTNAASGSVSVVALDGPEAFTVLDEVIVGPEPRGIAVTPNGSQVFVALHTAGTVSVIDAGSLNVVRTVAVGGSPMAVAISNDGDSSDDDETVFVTQFYAELIPGGPGEGFDDGKRAVVHSFAVNGGGGVVKSTLSPIAKVGFAADRTPFCLLLNPKGHSDAFCPDPLETDPTKDIIKNDPQGAYPNQLQSIVLRGGLCFVPNIGAGPEPPVRFNVNVQAFVHVLDAATGAERADLHVNLNDQIKLETQPAAGALSLDRLFGNDLVAIDANAAGTDFLIVSRGGNYVLRSGVGANGRLDIGAPSVVRFQTGNIPSGVVMSADGKRAYTNNEVNVSVTAINLENGTVLDRDIPCGTPPAPGTFEHSMLLGKLAFLTALGIPDNGILGTPVRQINALEHRNKASDNGWSSCGSCHPDGLADGVTWFFPEGPRQTLPLDAFFSKDNPDDQRISNWSGIRGSITDFNANARAVQGGIGFAGNPPPPEIYNHGLTQGASDSLDVMTLWVQTVRSFHQPEPTDDNAADRGRAIFDAQCATCHGGAKWTKSQVVYRDNPAFNKDPNAGGVPFDPNLTVDVGGQIVAYRTLNEILQLRENVGTFSVDDPLELRGAGGAVGNTALGVGGFNVPPLLGVRYHAPYLHNGAAQTLDDLFAKHLLDAQSTIADVLGGQELSDLKVFLDTIDGRTNPGSSATDEFLDAIGG